MWFKEHQVFLHHSVQMLTLLRIFVMYWRRLCAVVADALSGFSQLNPAGYFFFFFWTGSVHKPSFLVFRTCNVFCFLYVLGPMRNDTVTGKISQRSPARVLSTSQEACTTSLPLVSCPFSFFTHHQHLKNLCCLLIFSI